MSTVELNQANFEENVNHDGIVMVDWWAPWCGPCRSFGPIYEKVSEKHSDIKFGKVNTEDNQALGGAFQIRSIPTLSIFRDGIMVFNQAGMLPAKALEDIITQTKKLDMDDVRKKLAEAQKAQGQNSAASA